MTKVYISIVSHGHDDLISENTSLHEISKIDNVTVVVKDNLNSSDLERTCIDKGYKYLTHNNKLGFGENNNQVYSKCQVLGMADSDWFLCLNPDVTIDVGNFERLLDVLSCGTAKIFAANLFKDEKLTNSENSLRYFPNWFSPFKMLFAGSVTEPYDKNQLSDGSLVEWASGAFLVFEAGLYRDLNGFERAYFMYYEDVDICYRAYKKFGESVYFMKNVNAVHAGAYQNRNIFSQHFRWYLKSLFLFLLRK